MRPTLLALAAFALAGCASTRKQPDPQANIEHRTPVAAGKSSVSQRIIYHRLQEQEQVAGRTRVQGGLVR